MKTKKSPFKRKLPRAITLCVLNRFSKKNCREDVVYHNDCFAFFQCIQNMHNSSYIAEKPLDPTLTLKFDLEGSFVKFVPSQNRILYGVKMRNQS